MTTRTALVMPAYPRAERQEIIDVLHGHDVADPYRWLEDAGCAESRRWMEQQRAVTQAHLRELGMRTHFAARLAEHVRGGVMSVPAWRGERSIYLRRDPGRESAALYVAGRDGQERVVLDPQRLDRTGTSAIAGWQCSPDGRLLAYQITRGGSEQSELHVKDLDSGEVIDGSITGTRYSPVAWLPDASGFYYVRPVDHERRPGAEAIDRRVWLHRLGDDPGAEDQIVFGAGCDRTTRFDVSVDHGRWLIVSTMTGVAPRNDVYVADLDASTPERPRFGEVQVGLDALTYASVAHDGRLYLQTTFRAPRGRICVTNPTDPCPARWHALVPEDGEAALASFAVLTGPHPGATRLFVVRSRHATSEATVHDGASGVPLGIVSLPGLGSVSGLSHDPHGGSTVWFHYSDHITPPTVLRYDARRDTVDEHAAAPARTTVPATCRHTDYTSTDGARIRLFVIAPASCVPGPDRPRATMLTGYGGFGVSMTPRFHPEALAWVEAGGVFAIACLRGGGERGEDWHRAGMRANKQNAFDDFHAAAEWLIANGWTTPDRLGIMGASNAGLLVGAALTQRPDLYGAAVCAAPLLDMARYERSGLGASWRSEYGSACVPEELGWLLSYSPYHHVEDGAAYPATMFVVFETDTRVDPLHARKMCAALQHSNAARTPILFHGIPDVGHGARAHSRGAAIGADTLAFLAHHTGLTWAGDP